MTASTKPITLTTRMRSCHHRLYVPSQRLEKSFRQIFNLSGFEFTEYYFIVSKDGKELYLSTLAPGPTRPRPLTSSCDIVP